jgi:uncharacterized protein YqeY
VSELKKKLNDDMVSAAKSKDKLRLTTIRMIRASIKNKEIDTKKDLEDSDIISILATMAKQRKESIKLFIDGGRDDLAEKEKAEIKILQDYLPPQMSKEEVREKVNEVIQALGASDLKDLGKVMKGIMPLVSGKADGKEVSAIVKELLASD